LSIPGTAHFQYVPPTTTWQWAGSPHSMHHYEYLPLLMLPDRFGNRVWAFHTE
jgi:hypothetical protein